MNLQRRLLRLRPSRVALLGRAALVLLWVRLSLWMRRWDELPVAAMPTARSRSFKPGVVQLEWAVLAASRLVPRVTCLTQSIALHRLLSHYGYRSTVQFGARQADGRFSAHAWVEQDADPLLSKAADIDQYQRLFSWPPSRPDAS